jgi:hypothetical protein
VSPYPIEKPSKNSGDASARPVDLHGLRVFKQTDRGCELRVLGGRRKSRGRLRVRHVGRHFENFAGKVIDAIEQTASASDKNSRADVIDERLFFNRALQ